MQQNSIQPKKNLCLKATAILWLVLLSFVVAGCGVQQDDGNTGAMVFQVEWPDKTSERSSHRAAAEEDTPDVCHEYDISTITATLYNAIGNSIATGRWPCEKHQATLENIPAGEGYRLEVIGTVDWRQRWRGTINDITVIAAQTNYCGKVQMKARFLITSSAGQGGRIEPSGDIYLDNNAEQVFSFLPDQDYSISDVVVDDVSQGVIASFTFSDVSADHAISVFFVLQPRPKVEIISPSNGSIFTVGTSITFTGSAIDAEDDELVWTSDLDGKIGTGEDISTSELTVGIHQITLTATDSHAATGTDTIQITIDKIKKPIPDTGQTISYTDIFGEDADYTDYAPSYTKLDDEGDELHADATEWVMVRDNVTGLIWEVKTDDDKIHDKDTTYTWQKAQDIFIAQLNSDNFGGYSDWRLPTIKELSNLVYADAYDPAIDTNYFKNTMSSNYWSFTGVPYFNMEYAWHVLFKSGYVAKGYKTNNLYVRAVRGEQ